MSRLVEVFDYFFYRYISGSKVNEIGKQNPASFLFFILGKIHSQIALDSSSSVMSHRECSIGVFVMSCHSFLSIASLSPVHLHGFMQFDRKRNLHFFRCMND